MLSVFIIWCACGCIAGMIAQNKGQSGVTGFVLGFLLGPIGVLMAAMSGTNNAALEQSHPVSGEVKKCAEMLRPEATICRDCQQPVEALTIPSTGARIVATCNGGFLCSACGGGVRSDATECEHCHTPMFTPAATYSGSGKGP